MASLSVLSVLVVVVVAAGLGAYFVVIQQTTITDHIASTTAENNGIPTGVPPLSTSETTIYSTNTPNNFSYATVSADTTLSYTNSTGNPIFINYIAVTALNCSGYRFYVSMTGIEYAFPPYHYNWNFGDNSTWSVTTNATSSLAEHTYATTGKFLVEFSVYSTAPTPTSPILGTTRNFVVAVPAASCSE